jgi:replicative DNA helicase
MAVKNKLTPDFVIQLFATVMERRDLFEVVSSHLKFSYLQKEQEKKFWQFTVKQFQLKNQVPSWAVIQQHFNEDDDVLELILEIRESETIESETEVVLRAFEDYVRRMKFLEANDNIANAYNAGKRKEAYDLFVKYADEFNSFSIMEKRFKTVFGGFEDRQITRTMSDKSYRYRIPTGIDELDYRLGGANGGVETGEYCLWCGDSGVGKSQLLVHLGITAARLGYPVAHIQLEGTEEQCTNRYDAAWTGTLYSEVKTGTIADKKIEVYQKVLKKLRKSDVIVHSEETFNALTIPALRQLLRDMEKVYGKLSAVVVDYLELLEPGDGHNYSPGEERFRQAKLSKAMKMIAMEFNVVVHAATQSNNVPVDLRNDPTFVITRDNLNEDKGKLRPADLFITLNQTFDEMKEEMMRLHTDKLREHKRGEPILIVNNFSYARFYDRKKTMALLEDEL